MTRLFTAAAIALMATQATALDRPTWSPAKMEETQRLVCTNAARTGEIIMFRMDKLNEMPETIKQNLTGHIPTALDITDEFAVWFVGMVDVVIDGLYATLATGGTDSPGEIIHSLCISTIEGE